MVNNAGICTEAANPAPIDESSEEGFDRHLQINTKGAYLGCKFAVQQMKKQEPHACGIRGWIVNVASIGALIGIPGIGEKGQLGWLLIKLTVCSKLQHIQRCHRLPHQDGRR